MNIGKNNGSLKGLIERNKNKSIRFLIDTQFVKIVLPKNRIFSFRKDRANG